MIVIIHLSPWHLRRTLQRVNYHPSELHTWKMPHSHKHLFRPGWRIPPQSTSPKQELLCPSALPGLYLCLRLHLTVELIWSSNTACLVSPEKHLLLWFGEESQHLHDHVAIVLKPKENLCRAWWRLNRILRWQSTHHPDQHLHKQMQEVQQHNEGLHQLHTHSELTQAAALLLSSSGHWGNWTEMGNSLDMSANVQSYV